MDNQISTIDQKIGARVREARLAKGWSQAELAEQAHVSLPRISVIESGKAQMLVGTLVKLAEALQISTDALLRPNTPSGCESYQKELIAELTDCTPDEYEAIMGVVKSLKASFRKATENLND